MQSFSYPARLDPDEDGRFVVKFRDLPHGMTDGADRSEALAEAVGLLESVLAHIVQDDLDVPTPSSPRRNEVLISPSAVTAAQVALYAAMRQERVSHKELSKRLGLPVGETRRLTDLAKYPPLQTIERALATLGHRLTIALDAAE